MHNWNERYKQICFNAQLELYFLVTSFHKILLDVFIREAGVQWAPSPVSCLRENSLSVMQNIAA